MIRGLNLVGLTNKSVDEISQEIPAYNDPNNLYGMDAIG